MWNIDSLSARLYGVQARPVAAMLLAGSLMGFVLGQEAGHGHAMRQQHAMRPPVGAVATRPPVKHSPTKVPTVTHGVNPVASFNPPAARDAGDGDHHGGGGDGGDGGGQGGHHHSIVQGGQGGHGGHSQHGGNQSGDQTTNE